MEKITVGAIGWFTAFVLFLFTIGLTFTNYDLYEENIVLKERAVFHGFAIKSRNGSLIWKENKNEN